MSYLVCKKCNGYYKLKREESSDDFEECECGGELEYMKDEIFNRLNLRKENYENSKLNVYFKYFMLLIISLVTIVSIFSLHFIVNWDNDYNLLISIMLIFILILRFIFNEKSIFMDKTIFLIIPLLIIFASIVIYRVINI